VTHLEIIADLASHYGRKIPDTQFKFYVFELRGVKEDELERAVKECKRIERQFPTVKIIESYAMEAQRRSWEKAKIKTVRVLPKAKPSDPELIKESFRILHRARTGMAGEHRKTQDEREDLVAECMQMEKTWPGLGWVHAGEGLAKYYGRKANGA